MDEELYLTPDLVQGIVQAGRRKKAQERMDQTAQGVNKEFEARDKLTSNYQTSVNAPVKPQRWYQRLLQGGMMGLASRQPGESIAESLGRGLGFGASSAISPTGHGNIVRNIRNQQLGENFNRDLGVSNVRLSDAMSADKMAGGDFNRELQMEREDRLNRRGLQSYDQAAAKLSQRDKELQARQENFGKTMEAKNKEFEMRQKESEARISRINAQNALSQKRYALDERKIAEVERHNKEMEGKGETDQYIINAVGSKGEVKPMQLKVPKGEDPEKYIRTITTGEMKAGGTVIQKKSGAPEATADRNRKALEMLRPKKAGESKGLGNLIK